MTKPWPGLDPKKDEVTFNVTQLRNVLGDLERDLKRLQRPGPGSQTEAVSKISMPRNPLYDVDWPPADAFFTTLSNGANFIGYTYSEVVRKYEIALGLIRAAEQNNGSTESGNTQTASV
ncbi:hypothetical protein [Nonomuraea typhae]|uniref:PE domain-containing protein n=1 Tax=Nonomuraea typhae TaxID=2603600 RepID=A0ABW7Z0D0_9ACTN